MVGPARVEQGKFRADLLDRLSFEVITLPPLRSREGDVQPLAEHFGRRMSVELNWPNWPGYTPRAMAELEAYHWPGNVRELRNVVERAVYRHEDPERPVDDIVFNPFHSPWAPAGTDAAVASVEPVYDLSRVEVSGGGGTDMRVGINAALELRERPNVIVVLSDGGTPWPNEQPHGVQVVVGLVGSWGRKHEPIAREAMPWAEVVLVGDDT